MNINDYASIVAFARLLGIQGTDEEIIGNFIKHYLNAQKSLNKTKIPKELKRKRFNFSINIQGQDISEMVIFMGLFVFLTVLLLPATK